MLTLHSADCRTPRPQLHFLPMGSQRRTTAAQEANLSNNDLILPLHRPNKLSDFLHFLSSFFRWHPHQLRTGDLNPFRGFGDTFTNRLTHIMRLSTSSVLFSSICLLPFSLKLKYFFLHLSAKKLFRSVPQHLTSPAAKGGYLTSDTYFEDEWRPVWLKFA